MNPPNNPTPADPTSVVFQNACGNLAVADQARAIIAGQLTRMSDQLGKNSITAASRSELLGVVAELLSLVNTSIENSGKTLIKPTVATPAIPAEPTLTGPELLNELTSGRREPSPARPYPPTREPL